MKSKIVRIVIGFAVAFSVCGLFVWYGIGNSDAQSSSAKQFQFVLTGTTKIGRENVERYEDPEYKIVCYSWGVALSCSKK